MVESRGNPNSAATTSPCLLPAYSSSEQSNTRELSVNMVTVLLLPPFLLLYLQS